MKWTFLVFLWLSHFQLAAQSTISPTARYAYAANAGWVDSRPSLPDGVRVFDTALSGYSYAANFGWIHLGDGTPSNGHTYSNTSSTDYGVNASPTGILTGLAYAANIGWITFEQTHGQPKLDLRTGKFTGSIYSANIGWIALDTAFTDLATSSIARPDTDNDGIADTWENLNYGNLTTASSTSDKDGDGASDLAEYNSGTLPNNPDSLLKIVSHTYSASSTQADISFTTVLTRNYRLEYDEDLVGPWTDSVLGSFLPTGSLTSKTLSSLSPAPRRFFRAVAMPLPTAP
ncbi:MAG: hypothetical protein ACRCXD_17910 [Luteolibacter sp.]